MTEYKIDNSRYNEASYHLAVPQSNNKNQRNMSVSTVSSLASDDDDYQPQRAPQRAAPAGKKGNGKAGGGKQSFQPPGRAADPPL